MTEVVSSCSEMTALAPPSAQLITSRNASPCRSPSNHRSPTGSRHNLAKERKDDREKTQEVSELLRDKERRVQQQLERCAEERGRKMQEQKKKEQKRRAAAEEKRKQQKEAEKERSLMMHSLHVGKKLELFRKC